MFVIEQLPLLPPGKYEDNWPWTSGRSGNEWVSNRVMELIYTSYDIQAIAHRLNYVCPPFKWDLERRFMICCELDAAYFQLYGIKIDDVDHVMETFPTIRRRDEQRYGEYRTKRVILEIYDEMVRAMQTGIPYQTRLDPPPSDPRVAHQEVAPQVTR